MKKKIFIFTIAAIILVICIFINKTYDNYALTVTSNSVLSKEKIGWGIKRKNNHEQPDLGSKNKTLIDKYNGIAMGSKEKKYIYLTFDEGYEAGFTDKILQTLNSNNVKAAFFITAHYLNTQPELVQKMINEGHIVGNHTVNHKSMPSLSLDKIKTEVMNLHSAIYEKFGYEMKYIRPPMGEFSEFSLSATNNLGYTTVMWSLAYDDWDENKQGRQNYAREKILSNIHPGCVMLLHGNSSDNCEILGDIIQEIKKMGYEFKTLDEFEK